MTTAKVVRYVSTLVALCGVTFLMVDFVFVLAAPTARGSSIYIAVHLAFQAALIGAVAKRKIEIYCGR